MTQDTQLHTGQNFHGPQEKEAATAESRVLYFDNHLPIRIKGQWQELWLGFVHLDFGGAYIRAYQNKKGEYLIWHRHNSAYSDGRSYSTYVGKFRPGPGIDIIDKFPRGDADNWDGTDALTFSTPERGKIQVWLEGLGLSQVEEF